jgi:molecular chaperone GrpE
MAKNLHFWKRKSKTMNQEVENQANETSGDVVNEQSSVNTTNEETAATENSSDSLPNSSELDKLKDEVAVLNDKLLRSMSEFDNFRRRTAKERLELISSASRNLLLELLPVLDDFERALQSMENEENSPMKEGVQLVHTKFLNILSKQGLQAIDSVGHSFDTDLHEAISKMPAPSEDQKNVVLAEVEKGYKLNDAVIRYAKVIVGV